jgi:hypothetical protein
MKTRVPLVQIDIGLLADQVGVSATDTLDLGQGVHDLLLAIDVGVQQSDDVLEAGESQLSSDIMFPPHAVRYPLRPHIPDRCPKSSEALFLSTLEFLAQLSPLEAWICGGRSMV